MIGTPGWALICIGVIAIIWRLTELSRLTREVEETRKALEKKEQSLERAARVQATGPSPIALGGDHDDYALEEDTSNDTWEEDDEDSPTTLFGYDHRTAPRPDSDDVVDSPTTMMPRAPLWRP